MTQQLKRHSMAILACTLLLGLRSDLALAINGGPLQVTPRNSWRAFEVISVGENPAGDDINYSMLGAFDGLGAWLPDAATLRVQLNHETADASVSEVNLHLANFQTAIKNMIVGGTTGGVTFVTSAQQAYDRWSADGGTNWTNTTDVSNTSFSRFCSSQSYKPNTFGTDRGFVDDIYITGEEFTATNRLFAIDSANRDFYQLSGVTGSASGGGGIGGMPYDSWENAALLDTSETNHVALLLSPDGGTQIMQLYIGEKGKGINGSASSSFLARNGLAYGSYYYLNDTLPASGTSTDGFFDTTTAGALYSAKLEDVDTNPNYPTQTVIGIQETGLFTFDFALDFGGGGFSAAGSSFSVTKIQNHVNDTDGAFGDADNVDWTAATTLGGVTYANGLIFVNEDSFTAGGETWMTTPTASAATTLIGDTIGIVNSTETTGVLDISNLLGYRPGSVLLANNQGTAASLSVLIHPNAKLSADFNGNGIVDAADYAIWRNALGQTGAGHVADASGNGIVDMPDYDAWRASFGNSIVAGAGTGEATGAVPEPSSWLLVAMIPAASAVNRPIGVRRRAARA